MKRLRMALASDGAYNEVNFTYGEDGTLKDSYDPSEPTGDNAVEQPEEEPFIAPPELAVPEGMEVPPTEKMNAIIEKTAVFVAQHGLQMEIVIKTKQAANQQLLFMQFDHPLNPYYKHMIQCIKSGTYHPVQNKKENGNATDEDEDDDDDGEYLHPSLFAKSSNPTSDYSTTLSGESYSYLTSSYTSAITSQSYSTGVTYAPRSQGDDWYSLLVKQLKDKVSKNLGSSHSPSNATPPTGMGSPNSTPVVESGSVASSAAQLGQYSPYVTTDPSLPTPPGLEPVTLPPSERGRTTRSSEGAANQGANSTTAGNAETTTGCSASNYLLRESHVLPPPPDIQPIVDKMAAYVAKNGKDFETVVLNKGDVRFEFLHSWHEFHPYYLFKKSVHEMQMRKGAKTDESVDADHLSAPVSFSIKSKDPDVAPLEKRNAFALDESSDSDAEGEKKQEKVEDVEKKEENKEKMEKVQDTTSALAEKILIEELVARSIEKIRKKQMEQNDSRKAKAELELRQAEEKVKDRLAAAAREKLSSASREKQLQQERKRRAALFLTMLKKDAPNEDTNDLPSFGPQLPNANVVSLRLDAEESRRTDGGSRSTCILSEKLRSSNDAGKAGKSSRNSDGRAGSSRRSRSNSPPPRGRSSRSGRSRSKSPSRGRKRWSRRRSRSRSKTRSWKRGRSRSPSRSENSKAKTPPAAYAIVRRSNSPSPHRSDDRSRSRSRDRLPKRYYSTTSFQGRKNYNRRRDRASPSPPRRRSRRSSSTSGSRRPSPRTRRSPSGTPERHERDASRSVEVERPDKTASASPKAIREGEDKPLSPVTADRDDS